MWMDVRDLSISCLFEKDASSIVKKVATIAKELGREIATPDEARGFLGMNR